MTLYTTLNAIRTHNPCEEGWRTLLAGLGKTQPDDEPLPFARIVEINGMDDALWTTRSAPKHSKEWQIFAVGCARSVVHLSNDWRVVAAINVAERYAHGAATREERDAAADAARAAADAVWDAADAAAWAAAVWDAADAAAWAAAVWDAADAAAWAAAAWDAAVWDAVAWAAAAAARAAADAVWDAAADAAWAAEAARAAADAAWADQKAQFLKIVG